MSSELLIFALFFWVVYLLIEMSEIKLKLEGKWTIEKVNEFFVLRTFILAIGFVCYV